MRVFEGYFIAFIAVIWKSEVGAFIAFIASYLVTIGGKIWLPEEP